MTSLVRTIGRGTFWTSGGTILVKVIGLANIFIILNRLNVYEYGLIKLAMSVVPVLGIFLLPGLTDVVIADMGSAKARSELGEAKGIYWGFFRLQVGLALIAWAVLFLGSEVIATFYKGQISLFLKIISFSFLVSPFRALATVMFNFNLKYFTQSMYSFTEEIVKFVLLLIFFFAMHAGPSGVLWSMVLSQVFVFVFFFPYIRKLQSIFQGIPTTGNYAISHLLLMHGKWNIFSRYVNNLGGTIRIWMIRFFIGTEAVGLFTLAQGLIAHTSSLVPINQVIAPLVPQYVTQKERFAKIISKSIKYQFFASIIVGIIAYLAFSPLLQIFFPQYVLSIPLFKVMLLGLLGMSVASVLTSVFFSLKKQKQYFYSISVKTILILLLLPVFILNFGVIGIAMEYVLSMTIAAVDRYVRVRKFDTSLRGIGRYFFRFDEDDKLLISKMRTYVLSKFRMVAILNKK